MSLGHPQWRGRRKRTARRMAHDLRQLAPMIAIAFCFAGTATAILVVHHVPTTGVDALPAVSAERSDAEATTRGGVRSTAGPAREAVAGAGTRDAAGCPAAPVGSVFGSGS